MILLVGAGTMAKDYAKVLQAQNQNFIVIGRGTKSADIFFKETGINVETGGLEHFLTKNQLQISQAIIAVGVEQLFSAASLLIKHGIRRILIEKPAGLTLDDIASLHQQAEHQGAEIFVAYNRRFYSSVEKALEIIEEDGGVQSFNFEITEWGHVIAPLSKAEGVKENWFLGNTTHVVDLAFFLGGTPKDFNCYTSGSLDWHTRSSSFAGAGICDNGALFCYHGNWSAPGRWSVEMLTREHRLIFRPMEKLQIQKLGSVAQEFIEISDKLDVEYKPGLFKQVQAFLSDIEKDKLCPLSQHLKNARIYAKMAGY